MSLATFDWDTQSVIFGVEPHDVHFTVTPHPEPDDPSSTHVVEMRAWVLRPEDERWPCETLTLEDEPFEVHVTGDPYGMVEAHREAQTHPLEARLDMEYEREMEERATNGGF